MEQKLEKTQGAGGFARIFRKKSPEEIIGTTKKAGLAKTLGAFDLTVLGIGAIIGSGIFTLAGTAALGTPGNPGAGPGLMISFIFAAIACGFAALCYAEFATMIPAAGSTYTYTFATLGELAAWLIGWILMLEYAIGNITVACGWTGYVFEFLKGFTHVLPAFVTDDKYWIYQLDIPSLHHTLFLNIPAIFIMLLVTAILYKGVQESTKMAGIMVAVKIVVIALFVGIGAFYVKPANWHPFVPNGFNSLIGGAAVIFFAYIGFDAVSTAAEETKDPQKNLPIGIISSLVICTLIYIIVAAVLTGIIPYKQINAEAPVAAAMRLIGHGNVAGFISFGAVAGLTSVLLVLQYGAIRILYAMSRDGLLPKVFSKVHPKFKTPHIITIIAGIFVALGTVVLNLDEAARLCNIGTLTAFMVVCASVIILRIKDPHRERPFKVPFSPLLPLLGIGSCFWLITGLPLKTIVLFGLWIVAGIAIYFAYAYRRPEEPLYVHEEVPVIEETTKESQPVSQ
ncbi:MAG: amino acid permease [bacterium]